MATILSGKKTLQGGEGKGGGGTQSSAGKPLTMGVSSVSNAKSVTRSFLATGTGASGWHSTDPVTAKLASSTPDPPSSTLSPATAARTASPLRSRPLTVATSSAGRAAR